MGRHFCAIVTDPKMREIRLSGLKVFHTMHKYPLGQIHEGTKEAMGHNITHLRTPKDTNQ